MAGKSITLSTSSVGKTARIRESASATKETRKRVVRSGKPAVKPLETHQGSTTDILSTFAELYRQL